MIPARGWEGGEREQPWILVEGWEDCRWVAMCVPSMPVMPIMRTVSILGDDVACLLDGVD